VSDSERIAPRILGVGHASPEHSTTQDHVAGLFAEIARASHPGSRGERLAEFIGRVAPGTGIARRASVLGDFARSGPDGFEFFPRNWALEPFPGTQSRMRVYEAESAGLAARAARAAIDGARVEAREITHLVVATCTGFFAPGPDVSLVDRLGLDPAVERTIVGFLGCQGGLVALRTADAIARGDPASVVLVVAIELCSLHFQKRSDLDLAISNLIFADGAGAAVVAGRAYEGVGRASLDAVGSRLVPGTREDMGWRIGDHGFEMRLSPQVPERLGGVTKDFVEALEHRDPRQRVGPPRFAVHPGGPRVLEAVEEVLGLAPEALTTSREVLRDHGNMSSATIFYILERELLAARSGERIIALAFGPGLTIEGVILGVR
jgi:predicted naringenin-chalcone synthase